jgi:hypothetical protein
MTFLTRRGEGPSFPYAGEPMHILAGHDDQPAGFAAAEIAVPAGFPGPVPHAHDAFEVGAVLQPGTPPDPAVTRDVYTRHASRLLP